MASDAAKLHHHKDGLAEASGGASNGTHIAQGEEDECTLPDEELLALAAWPQHMVARGPSCDPPTPTPTLPSAPSHVGGDESMMDHVVASVCGSGGTAGPDGARVCVCSPHATACTTHSSAHADPGSISAAAMDMDLGGLELQQPGGSGGDLALGSHAAGAEDMRPAEDMRQMYAPDQPPPQQPACMDTDTEMQTGVGAGAGQDEAAGGHGQGGTTSCLPSLAAARTACEPDTGLELDMEQGAEAGVEAAVASPCSRVRMARALLPETADEW